MIRRAASFISLIFSVFGTGNIFVRRARQKQLERWILMTVTKKVHFDIRRKIVANMTTEGWAAPHVSYTYEADITGFIKTLEELNASGKLKNKITVNTAILKVIAEGLKAAPACNAHIEFNAKYVKGTIKHLKEINISMPWIMDNGEMMTINLRDVGERSLDGIADLIAQIERKLKKTDMNEAMYSVSFDNTMKVLRKGKLLKALRRLIGAKVGHSKVKTLKGKAKRDYEAISENDRLTLRDIEQGSVTVSNIGSIYREQKGFATLLDIIPPQVLAVCIGAAQKKPLVVAGADGSDTIEIRRVLPLCFTFDHRALDFGDIIPLLKRLNEIFEAPEQIMSR